MKLHTPMGNGMDRARPCAPAGGLESFAKVVPEKRRDRMRKRHETRSLDPAEVRSRREMNFIVKLGRWRRRRRADTDFSNRGITEQRSQDSASAGSAADPEGLGKNDAGLFAERSAVLPQ